MAFSTAEQQFILAEKNKLRIQQTGNDFKKVMYSNHTGPDAMSDPGRTIQKISKSNDATSRKDFEKNFSKFCSDRYVFSFIQIIFLNLIFSRTLKKF